MDNRPSIDDIISQWFHDHNKRFRKENRQDAIRELVEIMVHYGYSRSAIEGAKSKIMKCLVGPSSPRGNKGLKEWSGIASDDFKVVLARAFSPIEKPTGPVHIPYEAGTDEPVEVEIETSNDTTPENEESTDSAVEFTTDPVIRPELDRSRFKNIETTPMMSEEEFFAMLERENNER